ncbi:MAG: DUF5666 domain-containing protein [Candidatus Acidiferrum sp.]
MNRRIRLSVFLGLFGMLSVAATQAQDEPSTPPQQQGQGRAGGGREGGPKPLFGKITAMHDGSIEITGPDGQAVTVKVTSQTEFRKDREPAKATDFKVGDMVMVRGDENPDHTVTAKMIGARTGGPGGGPGGSGGRPGGGMMMTGTLGKDYVAGEVKAIDAPKLTVLRTDNVTQVLELNEDTSLRRGRDSITMADIKVGDHVMARGAVQNDVFVPKGVMVMSPEQWQRMQERMSQDNAAKPGAAEATAPKPQE